MDFTDYRTDGFYDELFTADGRPRPGADTLIARISRLPAGDLERRQATAERALLELGITFTIYAGDTGTERIWPFDIIPRIVQAAEWETTERGLRQRIKALNLFIDDCYHDQEALKDGVVPTELITGNPCFRKQLIGFSPPRGVWCHITGTDLVRDRDGRFHVLEDNLRCPSGASYVLENRQLLKRTFPMVFEKLPVRSVDDYPQRLRDTLAWLSPLADPVVAVLTPGIYNSAYFEHSYLAQQMGVQLVEGRDLVVQEDVLYMKNTRGLQRVDVLYRRIDDDFLDPEAFRADSMLGVPGIMRAYRAGNVALANAPGTGIADDKAVYAYVPKLIKYYLDEEPILPNVPTRICRDPDDLAYVLEHLHELVVKAVGESGGYGMLVGPHSTAEQRSEFAAKLRKDPANYIAQPTLALSRAPIIAGERLEGRHVDLRPYILHGEDIYVMPGGLTRVALKKGSLVVNSSQGGGSKDTWVLAGGPA